MYMYIANHNTDINQDLNFYKTNVYTHNDAIGTELSTTESDIFDTDLNFVKTQKINYCGYAKYNYLNNTWIINSADLNLNLEISPRLFISYLLNWPKQDINEYNNVKVYLKKVQQKQLEIPLILILALEENKIAIEIMTDPNHYEQLMIEYENEYVNNLLVRNKEVYNQLINDLAVKHHLKYYELHLNNHLKNNLEVESPFFKSYNYVKGLISKIKEGFKNSITRIINIIQSYINKYTKKY